MRALSHAHPYLKLFLTIALVIGLDACSRQDALVNPTPVDYPGMTMQDMENAIFEASAKRGWSASKIREGLIESALYLREHVAVVRINYMPGRFAIKYERSEKLNYGKDKNGGELIHPNYNSWVQNLKNDITVAVAQRKREKEG
jgi:hypothetical protein